MTGKVYLIGAGPGDPGLMTIKGMQALKMADVIVYDHLASEALLNEAKSSAVWIDAGKMAGNHRMKQDEINAELIRQAKLGHTVARLKGGDPFIFGRGGEEAIALKEQGISYEIIPGVSSSYAAAAYCGIPVTHRHVASSFHVITGHEDPLKGESVLDYAVLAREEGTLVFLMGLSRIGQISAKLIENGRDAQTPAAVISNGTTTRQRSVTGTLATIEAVVKSAGILPPAILVVGDVVALQKDIAWHEMGPLAGKRILVTATAETAGRLSASIRTLGGEGIPLSLIHIKPCENLMLKPVLAKAKTGAWFVFTSRNGVKTFFDAMRQEMIDYRLLGDKHFAVLGSGTREALHEQGFYPELLPEEACSRSLAESLTAKLSKSDEVILFRAKVASPVLPEILSKAGFCWREVPLYETELLSSKNGLLNQLIDTVDAVLFCSASGVRAYAQMADHENSTIKNICIGPVTEAEAVQHQMRVDAVAAQYDMEGLIQTLCEQFKG